MFELLYKIFIPHWVWKRRLDKLAKFKRGDHIKFITDKYGSSSTQVKLGQPLPAGYKEVYAQILDFELETENQTALSYLVNSSYIIRDKKTGAHDTYSINNADEVWEIDNNAQMQFTFINDLNKIIK